MTLTSDNGTNYPAFTVTNGSRTPTVWGLRFGSEINGGYSTCEFKISDDERASGGTLWRRPFQTVTVKISDDESAEMQPGEIVWQGYLEREVAQSRNGECTVRCVGGQHTARTTNKTLLYRTDDYSLWGERNGEQFNVNANYRHISAKSDGSLTYHAGEGGYTIGNSGGLCIVVEEAKARKITMVLNKKIDGGVVQHHPKFSFRVRSFTAPLANGDESQMIQLGNLISLASTGAAQHGSTSTRTCAVGQAKNALNVDLFCDTDTPLSEANVFNVGWNTVRVYDIADTDSYYASTVMTDLASRLGYNSTGVVASSNPVLPIFWQRDLPIADLMDDMGTFEGYYWRVLEKSGAQWKLQFSPWDGGSSLSTTWTTTFANIYDWDVQGSADLINAARVYYRTLSGQRRHVTVKADGLGGRPADPFTGTDRAATGSNPVFLDYELEDRQPNTTLATYVGTKLVNEFAVQRYEGTCTLASASSGGEKPAPMIVAGDKLTVGGVTYRIYEAEHTDGGPSRLTIGRRPDQFQKWVAQRMKRVERKGGS